jgi:hypothetical protein
MSNAAASRAPGLARKAIREVKLTNYVSAVVFASFAKRSLKHYAQ